MFFQAGTGEQQALPISPKRQHPAVIQLRTPVCY